MYKHIYLLIYFSLINISYCEKLFYSENGKASIHNKVVKDDRDEHYHKGVTCVVNINVSQYRRIPKVHVTWWQSNKDRPSAPFIDFPPSLCTFSDIFCEVPLRNPKKPLNKINDDNLIVYCTASLTEENKYQQDLISKKVTLHVKDSQDRVPTFTKPSTEAHLNNKFENVKLSIVQNLTDINKIVRINSNNHHTTKLYAGTDGNYINLTCLAENVPETSRLTWMHYSEDLTKGDTPQNMCRTQNICQAHYEAPMDSRDDGSVLACILEETYYTNGDPRIRNKTLEVLLVRKITKENLNDPSLPDTESTPPQASISTDSFKLSPPIIAVLSVVAIIIALLVLFMIYYFKYRGKTNKNENEEHNVYDEITYAKLSLPKPTKKPLVTERVQYSEVMGVLKPKQPNQRNK